MPLETAGSAQTQKRTLGNWHPKQGDDSCHRSALRGQETQERLIWCGSQVIHEDCGFRIRHHCKKTEGAVMADVPEIFPVFKQYIELACTETALLLGSTLSSQSVFGI